MKPEKNNKPVISQIRIALESAHSIGLTTHVRPDGDAVGGVLGLGLALSSLGKQVQMVLPSGVSHTFRHLHGSEQVQKAFTAPCDFYISLDCADLKRSRGLPVDAHFDLNIDHHITNEKFAAINLVVPDAVATCAILTEIIPQLGMSLSQEVASALLTGIVSDSIGFRTSNTNIQALKLSAALMEAGADLYTLYNKALISRPYNSAKYWGFALSRMQKKDGVVWTSLTLEDRKESGYKLDDDADLTNLLSSIEESRVSVLFVEHSTTKTKVSWRSVPGVDVSALAAEFNGGGHPAAAGAELNKNLAETETLVIARTLAYLHSLEKREKRGDSEEKNGVGR
jgi:bifunctional oligoribonuclease and PAP phosphatase NrnA